MADGEEDFSSLPLEERFANKSWKVRKEAYGSAKTVFENTADESDPAFVPFLRDPDLWKGVVTDSHVAAQADGLAAYCAFLKFGGTQACTRSRGFTIGPIAEKCLPAPKAKPGALEAILLFVKFDKADPVFEALVPQLTHKLPKMVAATFSAFTAIHHNYGCKTVDPKQTLKTLPTGFAHADKNVRVEVQNLAVELYRWLGEAIKSFFWAGLKPTQQADLEKLFEKVKQEPPPQQIMFTAAQEYAMASASPAAEDGGEAADTGFDDEGDEEEVDGYNLADPVDVMSKIPKDFQDQMASKKWQERVEALEALHKAIDVFRIKPGPFDDIVQTLAANVGNVNIKVMTGAANCISKLASGLRGGFLAKYRGEVMRPLFSRLKEVGEKAKPVFLALQAVFETATLSDCLETTLEFLKDKNPRIKQGTSDFLVHCLEKTKTVPSKAEQKEIAEAGGKLLPESAPATREGGAKILGTLMKITGERATYAYLTGVDKLDKYKPKIAEYFETAKVVAKERPKPIVAPPKPAAPAGKKVVGKKPALGMKKPAPAAAAPPAPESPAKTAPRALPSKLGGVPKPGGLPTPGAGLKLQRKLAGPGSAASPSRRVADPPSEDTAPPPAAPKFGLGRGLAGRPIAKPSAPVESAPSPVSPAMNAMSAADRAELEELRMEKESSSRTIEDMKSERSRLNSTITELQNQNAQLIEDHTRDVLSIKAKETQLVRARSDAEAAEANVQKQQREIERLKRELARALRASAMSPPNATSDTGSIGIPETNSSIYQEPTGSAHAFARNGLHAGSRFESARPRSIVSASPSEEKENTGLESPGFGSRDGGLGRRKLSPTYGYSGIASPTRSSTRNSNTNLTEDDQQQPRSTEPAENWKRAAEVTSQLKARIEQMKVRQGLSRQPAQR
ncbi:hypothetical protein PENARI_c004G06208 [Penicillium arizonense]|uniref:TOG domain-containing protein n=1 Tax=Penicillium arizonense TaxID=1835702 RepID=A0A1F5LR56_PENAI|nr:hypothetical protein PENARI_c004G06208 [Penicillium arizonense]OGE55607.1 hypothetical protein PENARI_c004G06208 [Penicillium arizonense]